MRWALAKLDFYVRGSDEVTVFTDCSGIPGLFKKNLADIKNPRIQRMLEKFSHLNVRATHVKGHTHKVADALSRNPLPGTEGEEFPMRIPTICARSRRVVQSGVDMKDPLVIELAAEGKKCEDYSQMVRDIQEGKDRKELKSDSELLKLEGLLTTVSVVEIKEGSLIVRNGARHRERSS